MTQAHTLGPRVVGGGMGLRRARRSSSPEAGRGGAQTQGSGETEPAPRGRARRSPPSGIGRGEARGLGVRRGGATLRGRARRSPRPQCRTRRSPALRGRARLSQSSGFGKSCSRALDRSDESTLTVISSSSSGTLVLVPDNYIRMYVLLLIRSIYVSPGKNQHVYCFLFLIPDLGENCKCLW